MASLTPAQRRSWTKRLTEAQEKVEAAELERDKLMAAAILANFPYAGIENATGLGPHTVRNRIDAVDAG